VVRLATNGLSNPDIGTRLFMSRSTVKTHLSHIYAKLGVAHVGQAAIADRVHHQVVPLPGPAKSAVV
jgi:ATP/maltotriose-dependent transcriptional regulator MalT